MGLLFYTKVRSCRKPNASFGCVNLNFEIFLRQNKNKFHVQFHDEEFVVMLAYLADVFGHLNDMNLSLQGRNVTVRDVKNKLAGHTA